MKSRYTELLSGGDLRSIGRTNETVIEIGNSQTEFDEVFKLIYSEDKIIRARAADTSEKCVKQFPGLIVTHKKEILKNLEKFAQSEVRWHMLLMLQYLNFSKRELPKLVTTLQNWLVKEKHIFVRVYCMQALADIALKEKWLKNEVIGLIENEMERGSAAIKARGRILLKRFSKI